jgi:hypothetical protein
VGLSRVFIRIVGWACLSLNVVSPVKFLVNGLDFFREPNSFNFFSMA